MSEAISKGAAASVEVTTHLMGSFTTSSDP